VKKLNRMNAYILGGGKSSRMKRDKAFLHLGTVPFIDIVADCTSKLFDRVYLVGKTYRHPHLTGSLRDEIEGIGPLGGIYTALRHTDKEYNFFIGVDYPLINHKIILYLASFFKKGNNDFQGIIPVTPDGPHPLFSYYTKSCLPAVERCIAMKNYRVQCISSFNRIRYVELAAEMSKENFESQKRSFSNINDQEDLKKARDVIGNETPVYLPCTGR
jgi:molybdopterin-guanine dinucleotide biosynthesis protein A